jgi:hypothetical protein
VNQTERQDFERRKEVAMQKIRPMVMKELDKMLENFEEGVEDSVIEALVDAGIDYPIDPDADPEAVDAAIGLVQSCIDESTKFWHGTCHGPVWVLLSFNNDSGIKGLEVEVFGDRPRTWENGGNWPQWFRVYTGNIDGGDTTIGDAKGANFG